MSEVIRGLVKQDEVRRREQHLRKERDRLRSPPESTPNLLEDVVLGKQKASQQAAQFRVGPARGGFNQIV